MTTSTDRLIARVTKLTRRRPSPPRELRQDATRNLLTWKPPVASGAPFTHYRVRIDHDGGEPDFEVSCGQRSLTVPTGSRVFLTAYNQTNGFESPRVWSAISGGGGTGGDYISRIVFDFPDGDPIDIGDISPSNFDRVRLTAGKRVQLDSVVIQTTSAVDGDLSFDVLVSADGAGTWGSIFNATFPQADDGLMTGDVVTDLAVQHLNIDDLIKPYVLATGNNTVIAGEIVLAGRVVAA